MMMNRSDALGALVALAIPLGRPGATLAQLSVSASESEPAQAVVSREVVAFNAHDAAAVAKFHATSASLTVFPSGKVLASGTDQLQAFFAQVFEDHPNVKLTLDRQIIVKNVVINHYAQTGGTTTEVVSIYHVENDVIANEWFVTG